MERKLLTPYFVVIGLMTLTSLVLAFTVDVHVTNEAGIKMFLPEQVGLWRGSEMRFCQNSLCQRQFRVDDLNGSEVCPVCGGPLDTMTKGEKDLLPPDTEILKEQYIHPSGKMLFVAIVLSGKERASIHRPQVCLVGQGNQIVNSTVISVSMNDRKPLKVMDLEMLRQTKQRDGKPIELATYYAYWFVGKGRETPYHIQRMVWMATDRIFHNVSHRWAYISVSGQRNKDSEAYKKDLEAFIRDLYPQIVVQ